MNKQTVIETAAREVIAHGGPAALTDPHIATEAMRRALALGATHDDIRAEMAR
ncbi:hypothetical protein ACFQ6O_34515 [Streptomyces sp. NPDC056441]|uniref:hypothetical protein n=1 Tax=Streptomyces sp. NPDC056441 TaxID=3345817 RepID=UPI0036776AA9